MELKRKVHERRLKAFEKEVEGNKEMPQRRARTTLRRHATETQRRALEKDLSVGGYVSDTGNSKKKLTHKRPSTP